MCVYLSEIENISLSILHIMTRDDLLFDYLIYSFQNDTSYQPGQSKKAKTAIPTAVKKPMALTTTEVLSLEMRYSGYKFIA
jgi:hypothetical protein